MNQSAHYNQQIYKLLLAELALETRAPLKLPARSVLFPSGQVSQHVYCLISGNMHIELYPQSLDGSRVIPMSFKGGMALLIHTPYDPRPDPGTMVASNDAMLYAVHHDEFRAVMHANVERLELVTRFLAARLSEARKRERQWVERGVQERVAMALDYMAGEVHPLNNAAGAKLQATHELIAERSGVSRAKASRELKRLEQAGHIRLARSGVEILDREALRSA